MFSRSVRGAEVVFGAWHSNAESHTTPKAKTLAGISHTARLGSGIPTPKEVQLPEGAVNGSPEHDKMPPGSGTVKLPTFCAGTKRMICCGAAGAPCCATAGRVIPSTIVSTAASSSINLFFNFFFSPCGSLLGGYYAYWEERVKQRAVL
jgi:hypothetical protein